MGAETFHALKALLHERGLATAVGDEGGFAPDLASNEEAIAVDPRGGRARRHTATAVAIALDAASTELYRDGRYHLAGEGRDARPAEMVGSTPTSATRYPIVSIEDGLAEDDWDGWQHADRAARRSACSWSATTCS